jgi:hypothetical protein
MSPGSSRLPNSDRFCCGSDTARSAMNFTVPLCRGHHREVHHCADEAAWWEKVGIDPSVNARALWLKSHPLPASPSSCCFGRERRRSRGAVTKAAPQEELDRQPSTRRASGPATRIHAARGRTSRAIASPLSMRAFVRSCMACKFIQNSGLVP